MLGMHLSVAHNIVHLVSGCIVFGAVYLLLGAIFLIGGLATKTAAPCHPEPPQPRSGGGRSKDPLRLHETRAVGRGFLDRLRGSE